ncbi:MAG: pyridoxal-phosphate-dependent aminotransferase family protein [Gemmatimonadota bacterium]
MTGFGRFFLPGPTEVRPEVLEALRRPAIGHRSAEIVELIEGMKPRLSALFRTERPVFLSTSSATGMMEAAITNLSRRRVLCLVCGAFSERFRQIAEACGRPADALETEWGEPSRPEALRERLAAEPGRYDLVTVVHSETSTGVLNPVAELAAVVREQEGLLLAVDTVSSLAGAPVLTDDWGLDFVLTGAQKALALPPGLALAVASERALGRAREVERRGFYFDLLKFERQMERSQTPNTPCVSLFFALDRQLARIEAEGLEDRWQRHEAMARRTHAWVEEVAARTGRPFRVLAPEGYRSPTVTAVRLPDGLEGPSVAARLGERGYTVAPGYGKLRRDGIRIGHMGDHTPAELEELLGVLGDVLEEALAA